jgi:hypothetical protein
MLPEANGKFPSISEPNEPHKEQQKSDPLWQVENHKVFVEALEMYGGGDRPWAHIVERMKAVGEFTEDEVKKHAKDYLEHLQHGGCDDEDGIGVSLQSGMLSPTRGTRQNPVRWTTEEDARLRAGVKALGPRNWKQISQEYMRGGRSEMQCLNRWRKVLQPGTDKDTRDIEDIK